MQTLLGHSGKCRAFIHAVSNHRSELGEHQNQLILQKVCWGWRQLHTSRPIHALALYHKVPLLGSVQGKWREWNGKTAAHCYMQCYMYSYMHLCVLWCMLKMGKRRVILLWRKKYDSLFYQSIDVKIKKCWYIHLKCCNVMVWHCFEHFEFMYLNHIGI